MGVERGERLNSRIVPGVHRRRPTIQPDKDGAKLFRTAPRAVPRAAGAIGSATDF